MNMIQLARAADSLIRKGTTSGPLSTRSDNVASGFRTVMLKRITLAHCSAPMPEALDAGTISDVVRMVGALVVGGDGLSPPISSNERLAMATFMEDLITTVGAHPGGETIAKLLQQFPEVKMARNAAASLGGGIPAPASPVSPPPSPPPSPPAPPVTDAPLPDTLQFGNLPPLDGAPAPAAPAPAGTSDQDPPAPGGTSSEPKREGVMARLGSRLVTLIDPPTSIGNSALRTADADPQPSPFARGGFSIA